MEEQFELQRLQERVLRKKKLRAMLDSLHCRKNTLQQEILCRQEILKREQEDVDRLKNISFATLFYKFLGKQAEKLEKEQEEAHAAAARYHSAEAQLKALMEDIHRYKAEYSALSGCEKEYQAAYEKRRNHLIHSGLTAGGEILQLERKIAECEEKLREVTEAMQVGRAAGRQAEAVECTLQTAEHYGAWDMLGGGMLAGLAKHAELDAAQQQVEELQVLLHRYQTELADVQIPKDETVKIEGPLYWTDFLLDNFFVDWAVQQRICASKETVRDTRRQIEQMQDQLAALKDRWKQCRQQLQEGLDRQITGEACSAVCQTKDA